MSEVVKKNPLVLIIDLPAGCTPGRWEAAEAFAEEFKKLKEDFPDNEFHFLPFSYDTPTDGTNPALNAILAVAK